MYNIKTFRGTIFCSPIKYSKDFVASLGEMCDGYLPIIVRDNSFLPELPVWQLSSPDEKEKIMFNGEKIDLIQIVDGIVDDETVRTFSERCKMIFSKIMEVTSYSCTRIALAPSVVVTENEVSSSPLYNRLFAIRMFQDTHLNSSNLTQVYKVNKQLGEKEITINHVVNFHAERELVDNQIRDRYMGDFDINTMFNPRYMFSIDDVNQFFDFAFSNFKEFYNLYFAE